MALFPSLPPTPMPPGSIEEFPQPRQPSGVLGGVVNDVIGGIQSRNLLPALMLGGILGMVPPLFYKKRGRSAAARDWGLIGTQLAFNELNRPERERQERNAVLGQLVTSGVATPTAPSPSAKPIGDLGGFSLYQTPTLAESYPDLLTPSVPDAKAATDWQVGGPPDPMTRYTPPPVSEPPASMQMLGGLPATAGNTQKLAKITYDRQRAEEARQRSVAQHRHGQQYAKDNDLVYLPGMDAEGNPTFTLQQRRLPRTSKESELERIIRLKTLEKGSPLTVAEELAIINERRASPGKDLGHMAQQMEVRVSLQEARWLQQQLLTQSFAVPDKYKSYIASPTAWAFLKNDPEALAEINMDDSNLHSNITLLHQHLAENRDGFRTLMDEVEATQPARTKPDRTVRPMSEAEREAAAEQMIRELLPR